MQRDVAATFPSAMLYHAEPGGGGTWTTNIRGRAAGKSKKLPCPGVKFPKMIPCPGVKFS